jgi:predicted translin family RNA/ssDNA-binding protein
VLAAVEKEVRARIAKRDQLGEMARDLRRSSQDFMRHLHALGSGAYAMRTTDGKGDTDSPGLDRLRRYSDLKRMASKLTHELESEGWREETVAEAALQEWVEASLLFTMIEDRTFPTPGELGVHAEAYLLGFADVVGELRRLAITALGRGEIERAMGLLEDMDNLAGILMRFDFPRSVLSMKPKQDMARSLVERTRGDVEVARFLNRFAPKQRKRSKGRVV